MQTARALGTSRPYATLQSLLNMHTERRRLDLMASKLATHHALSAYEHDGLFIWAGPSSHSSAGWELELQKRTNDICPVSLKPILSREQIFDLLQRASSPTADRGAIDEDWERQLELMAAARPGILRGREDRLYAGIVALESTAYAEYPRPVRDFFKHDRSGTHWFFSPLHKRWEGDTEIGRNELLHVISQVPSRMLCDFVTAIGEHGGEVLDQAPPPEVLGGARVFFFQKVLNRCCELH